MPLIHAMHVLLKALAAFALMLWLMPVSAIALDTDGDVVVSLLVLHALPEPLTV